MPIHVTRTLQTLLLMLLWMIALELSYHYGGGWGLLAAINILGLSSIWVVLDWLRRDHG